MLLRGDISDKRKKLTEYQIKLHHTKTSVYTLIGQMETTHFPQLHFTIGVVSLIQLKLPNVLGLFLSHCKLPITYYLWILDCW